jgi:hypothetical protein
MKEANGGFSKIPHYITRSQELTWRAKYIYTILASYADKTGECYPGHEKVAKTAGVSINTVRRSLKELNEAGHISITARINRPNIYTFNWSSPEGTCLSPEGTCLSPEGTCLSPEGTITIPKEQEPPNKTQLTNEHTLCKEFFLEFYKSKFGHSYQWSAKDGKNLNSLIKKIQNVQKEYAAAVDIGESFQAVLMAAYSDKWIANHFEVATINSKFNSIIASYKNRDPYAGLREEIAKGNF